MKALICGAGRITRELLKRLGEGWEVTLVEKVPAQLEKTAGLFPNIAGRFAEDASSALVLKKAGLESMDYVLALTSDDEVNLAVAEMARQAGVDHVSALVYDDVSHKRFLDMGVHVIQGPGLVAQNLSHYLQDPRLHVTPLVSGPGAVYEVDASQHFRVVGQRAAYFNEPGGRLAGIFRKGRLLFPRPKTPIKSGDRLVIVGEPDIFEPVCRLLECGGPHFPMAYGQGMVLLLAHKVPDDPSDYNPILSEGLYLAQNTKVQQVTVLCPGGECGIGEALRHWPQSVQVQVTPAGERVMQTLKERCRQGNVGLAVLPPPDLGPWDLAFGAPLARLVHELGIPLLLARTTFHYGRILVPFNGSPAAELALEVAVDLSRQLLAEVTALVVEEPAFLSGRDETALTESLQARLRELGHVHKSGFQTLVRRGNPVRQTLRALEEDKGFGLLVLGSTTADKGFLTPNVGDLLARKAACSVLLLAP